MSIASASSESSIQSFFKHSISQDYPLQPFELTHADALNLFTAILPREGFFMLYSLSDVQPYEEALMPIGLTYLKNGEIIQTTIEKKKETYVFEGKNFVHLSDLIEKLPDCIHTIDLGVIIEKNAMSLENTSEDFIFAYERCKNKAETRWDILSSPAYTPKVMPEKLQNKVSGTYLICPSSEFLDVFFLYYIDEANNLCRVEFSLSENPLRGKLFCLDKYYAHLIELQSQFPLKIPFSQLEQAEKMHCEQRLQTTQWHHSQAMPTSIWFSSIGSPFYPLAFPNS